MNFFAAAWMPDVNEQKTRAVGEEVKALGRKATTFKADVTKRDEVYAAVNHAESALGGFDVMINNAGIAQVQPLADVTPEEVDKILKVNLKLFVGSHRRVPAMTSPR